MFHFLDSSKPFTHSLQHAGVLENVSWPVICFLVGAGLNVFFFIILFKSLDKLLHLLPSPPPHSNSPCPVFQGVWSAMIKNKLPVYCWGLCFKLFEAFGAMLCLNCVFSWRAQLKFTQVSCRKDSGTIDIKPVTCPWQCHYYFYWDTSKMFIHCLIVVQYQCPHVWIQNKVVLIISCLWSSYFQGCNNLVHNFLKASSSSEGALSKNTHYTNEETATFFTILKT